MRTPAEDYFGPEGFAELLEALTKFGQEKLGCTAISPPWLSVYVDGCEQRYHTDSWHGPWAFVLSLTGGRFLSKKYARVSSCCVKLTPACWRAPYPKMSVAAVSTERNVEMAHRLKESRLLYLFFQSAASLHSELRSNSKPS